MAKNFYFAWVDPNTAFDPAVHNVEDEDVFSFKISQVEGDFASLELVIKNPRVGLLKPGRKVWAWFSMDTGTVIRPLFLGRIVGLPTNLFESTVTLEFTARPTDFVAQKLALAETLKVLPYYDPIFISPESWGDPDVVLEGRTVLWHVDPITHVVTVSDILVPEDGTIDLSEDDIFYDSMSLNLEQVPLSSCNVTATIPWTQSAVGAINLTPLFSQFYNLDESTLTSFTMSGLIDNWPSDGDELGDGWEAVNSSLTDVSMTAGKPLMKIPDIFDISALPPMTHGSLVFPIKVTGEYTSGTGEAGFSFDFELVGAQLGYAVPSMMAQYTRQSEYGQVISFTLTCDMQQIITLASEDQSLIISVSANSVSDITEDGTIPIGDIRSNDYVNTPRGMKSLEHLILVARANLILRSRTVKISFQTPLIPGLDFNLRKGALIHDGRLPGGEAGGKVVAYEFVLDGDQGEPLATITIGCSIGYGNSHTPEAFDPSYVEFGYVTDNDYQFLINGTTLLGTSDVQYTMDLIKPPDDGLNFSSGISYHNVVKLLTMENSSNEQRAIMETAVINQFGDTYGDQSQLSKILQDHPTKFNLLLHSMKQGPFQWSMPVGVSTLVIPKQIDLEADSA